MLNSRECVAVVFSRLVRPKNKFASMLIVMTLAQTGLSFTPTALHIPAQGCASQPPLPAQTDLPCAPKALLAIWSQPRLPAQTDLPCAPKALLAIRPQPPLPAQTGLSFTPTALHIPAQGCASLPWVSDVIPIFYPEGVLYVCSIRFFGYIYSGLRFVVSAIGKRCLSQIRPLHALLSSVPSLSLSLHSSRSRTNGAKRP